MLTRHPANECFGYSFTKGGSFCTFRKKHVSVHKKKKKLLIVCKKQQLFFFDKCERIRKAGRKYDLINTKIDKMTIDQVV